MQSYKFETTISEGGIINIPEIKELANHKVDVFIFDKENGNQPDFSFEAFCEKWEGFLKNAPIGNWKKEYINYLEDKHK